MADFTITDGKAITCNLCGCTSHNPNDVEFKYCGRCCRFLDPGHLDQVKLRGLLALDGGETVVREGETVMKCPWCKQLVPPRHNNQEGFMCRGYNPEALKKGNI